MCTCQRRIEMGSVGNLVITQRAERPSPSIFVQRHVCQPCRTRESTADFGCLSLRISACTILSPRRHDFTGRRPCRNRQEHTALAPRRSPRQQNSPSTRPVVTEDGAIIRVTRLHSRYHRTVADLPWQGMSVTLELTTRKFFCDWHTCRQRVFTERLPGTVACYARRTTRAASILEAIGLAVGARPGAHLARQLGLIATADIILRRVRQRPLMPPRTPRILGVDDWAWKKRHTYGTLLCDLETGRIVDLLPNRSGETLATWLTAHPGIAFISRDRGGEYAVAATRAAPHAIQIADRFHLLMNLTDAMTRVLTHHL